MAVVILVNVVGALSTLALAWIAKDHLASRGLASVVAGSGGALLGFYAGSHYPVEIQEALAHGFMQLGFGARGFVLGFIVATSIGHAVSGKPGIARFRVTALLTAVFFLLTIPMAELYWSPHPVLSPGNRGQLRLRIPSAVS